MSGKQHKRELKRQKEVARQAARRKERMRTIQTLIIVGVVLIIGGLLVFLSMDRPAGGSSANPGPSGEQWWASRHDTNGSMDRSFVAVGLLGDIERREVVKTDTPLGDALLILAHPLGIAHLAGIVERHAMLVA